MALPVMMKLAEGSGTRPKTVAIITDNTGASVASVKPMRERLLKEMGLSASGTGSTAAGLDAVRGWLADSGLPADGVVLVTAVVAMDRAIHGFTMSLPAANDDSMEGHDAPRAEGMSSCWDDDSDLFSDSNAHHDVVTALAYMSDEQRGLFDLLAAHQDVPAAAKASGMSSATFYRRVDDLRMHLRMFGIRPAA